MDSGRGFGRPEEAGRIAIRAGFDVATGLTVGALAALTVNAGCGALTGGSCLLLSAVFGGVLGAGASHLVDERVEGFYRYVYSSPAL
jgi:hypothetical protein